MPVKQKRETEAHSQTSNPVAMLSEWARQGTESFFATQKILLDLVMRQNSTTFKAVKERFGAARNLPASGVWSGSQPAGIGSDRSCRRRVVECHRLSSRPAAPR
ncbi:hypothetical protein SBA3_2690009 [Candidatus Sulfopaludibacter sp. SbA3]|nr:hypothetical protein SBA3_2690009 [Candidatus Sulfopaludibacter sp. SbA3]